MAGAAHQGDQEIKLFYYHVTGQEVKTNDLSQFVPDGVFDLGGMFEYFMLFVARTCVRYQIIIGFMYLDCLLTSSVYDIPTLSRLSAYQTICFQSSLEFHCKHKHTMTSISNVCKFQVFFILVFIH